MMPYRPPWQRQADDATMKMALLLAMEFVKQAPACKTTDQLYSWLLKQAGGDEAVAMKAAMVLAAMR